LGLKANVTYFSQGTLEMRFGLFDLPVAQGWFASKKSTIAEVPLNLT
jgi:hypothetical protein